MILVAIRLKENQEAPSELGLLKKKEVCISSNSLTLYLQLRTLQEVKSAAYARKKLRKTHCETQTLSPVCGNILAKKKSIYIYTLREAPRNSQS